MTRLTQATVPAPFTVREKHLSQRHTSDMRGRPPAATNSGFRRPVAAAGIRLMCMAADCNSVSPIPSDRSVRQMNFTFHCGKMLFSRVQKSFTGMTVYLQVLQSTRAQRPAYRHLQGTLMTTVEGKCVHLRQRPAFHASVHRPDSAGGLQKCPPRLKKCFFCGSANVVWNGLRGRTQRYKCKGCGRRFDTSTQNVQVTTFSVGDNDKSGWQIERLRA